MARDHVLLLGARQQTKWSGGRGTRPRHSGPLGNLVPRARGASGTLETVRWPISSVVGAVAATLAGLKKKCDVDVRVCNRLQTADCKKSK